MDTLVKICGLSTPEAVIAAQHGGASHLGFIFFEKSPRHVSPEQAADLVRHADDCETVAVTVNADDAYLDSIVATMKPTMLQLHGSEDAARVKDVNARYSLPVTKAFSVRDGDDLDKVRTYQTVADMLLLDAKPPKGSDLPGGNGVTFDWSLVETLTSDVPMLLSGGVDQTNVGSAMTLVRNPANSFVGLDLSSGVESAPGVKDIGKIVALLQACSQS